VAIVGLVAAVSFISQYRVTPALAPIVSSAQSKGPRQASQSVANFLTFPVTTLEWEREIVGENVAQAVGQTDFWFENPGPVAIELGVSTVSCKCSSPAICVMTEGQKRIYQRWAYPAAAAELTAGFCGLLAELSALAIGELAAPGLNGLRLQ